MSVTLTGKDELLSYFGIPDVRYQPFETYYTIRKLNDGCLETGDKLFRAIFKRLHVNDIQFREDAKKRVMKIDHYNLKGYFYNTADFGISYTPDADRKGDVKTSIKFRVALEGVKIGGSLNYEDLGLHNDKDVEKFVKEFDGLQGIRPVEEAIRFISQRIIDKKGQGLYRAMAREIQEEGTPDKAVAKTIGTIVRSLEFVGFELDRRESWQTVVDFKFRSSEKYVKAREMDEFCCKMGDKGVVDIYFIYGGGSGRTYTTQLPYTLPAPSPVAVKKSIPKIVPMTVTTDYMKSLSPSRREEAKSAVFVPRKVPLKLKAMPFVPSRNLREGEELIKKAAKKGSPIVKSLKEVAASLEMNVKEWKPIEPYMDVLRDWQYESDSNSDTSGQRRGTLLRKKTRKVGKAGVEGPTGPQRRTVRRDKKVGSK